MAQVNQTVQAYFELVRLSNLPTCFSNILVGAALGTCQANLSWFNITNSIIAISSFYLAGMALNDLIDIDYDKNHRTDRPLASGRIGKTHAIVLIAVLFFSGLFIYFVFFQDAFWFALILVFMIVLYNIMHKKWSGSVVFMGLCRALIYVTVAFAFIGKKTDYEFAGLIVILPVILFLYTVCLTLIARIEDEDKMDYRKCLAIVMPFLVLAVILCQRPVNMGLTILAASIVLIWLGRACRFVWKQPPQTGKAVLTWLSGMCLIDGYFLIVLNRPGLAVLSGMCFAATVYGHQRIAGT